eukprot:3298093-Rhodomonas_salina.3
MASGQPTTPALRPLCCSARVSRNNRCCCCNREAGTFDAWEIRGMMEAHNSLLLPALRPSAQFSESFHLSVSARPTAFFVHVAFQFCARNLTVSKRDLLETRWGGGSLGDLVCSGS